MMQLGWRRAFQVRHLEYHLEIVVSTGRNMLARGWYQDGRGNAAGKDETVNDRGAVVVTCSLFQAPLPFRPLVEGAW